ncbi:MULTISPECIES: helix-turn-helix domain-containing protein [Microbacterium]|jgi:excisionase family DNA binding protein|uniref:helix-turn-helix domain-containing protein n=1 Tax=Microbacterium TaxID=33882 RepID=UPI00199A49E2|nr:MULTISPECIES: helix-turn-helix domain-containing protein [Microbacterium]MBD3758778.1 helix-turn-helix domain-containing protein [Microbacterium sp.]MBZ6372254.1 helix-turn-helix domain-containing protein [Microbacterium hominis]MCG7415338.1 helix-turn-helix domain-containing protein [Microbacterium aurum]
MPEPTDSGVRLLAPSQVAEMLQLPVDEVIALVLDGRLRGARIGTPARWRIEADSVAGYLDDQAEEARRIALWRESNAASFPELWGRGAVRNPD